MMKAMTKMMYYFLLWLCLLRVCFPGTTTTVQGLQKAHTYRANNEVQLRVNKLTSRKSLFPLPYYHLPHCEPEAGTKTAKQNLGQHLTGDLIQTSPYQLFFKTDMYCEHLCVVNLGHSERTDGKKVAPDNRMVTAIHQGYANNWMVDNLPSASITEDENYITTMFSGGVPLGYVDDADGKAYVYNHVNIVVDYHPIHQKDDLDENGYVNKNSKHNEYRVVQFAVEPFSIRHHFMAADGGKNGQVESSSSQHILPQTVRLKYPTLSCDLRAGGQVHTTYDTVFLGNTKYKAQPASGRVLFTYDVIWKESNLHWHERWDAYVSG